MDEESPSGFVETQRGIIRRSSYSQKQSSGSSGPDDGNNTLHFTATVSGHHSNKQEDQQQQQPNSEIIGSYLARQEFGSNEGGQPIGDSGYISHSSAGIYPKMPLPVIILYSLCAL